MIEFSYARVHAYVVALGSHQSQRSTGAYALPLFYPPQKFKVENPSLAQKKNLSKVGSWEQVSNKLQNSLPRPILIYHFFWDRLAPLDILILSFC